MIFDIEKYSKIPDGWSKVKLSDLADFNAKSWSKKDKPDTINYIDISSVSTGKVAEPTEMKFDSAPSRARRKVAKGDIIISTVRPNLKQFALLDFNNDNLTASTGFCTITPKKPEYTWLIYSVVTTDIFTEHLVRVAQGAAYPAIKPSDISEAYIGLPPQEELHKLNALIRALWQKQTINEAMNQTLERLAQRIFKSWFIDFDPVKANKEGLPFDGLSPEIQVLFPSEFEDSELGMIPKGWEVKFFGDEIKFKNGYAFKSKELIEDPESGTHRVFKMGNIFKGGGFKYNGSKDYFDASSNTKVMKHLAKKGDLLMCMTDMKANVALLGHTALMPVSDRYLVNQRVGHIQPKELLSSYFLYLLTNSKDFIHDLRSRSNSGVQVNLSTKAIKETRFICPDKNAHNAFNSIITPIFERYFDNEENNRTLESLRDRLLPKLISGQISVGEAAQELAEAV
jgi:type I restriction enzyme, S subunit